MSEIEENGVRYSPNYEELLGTTSISTANISSKTKVITGSGPLSYSFINAAKTLTSFTFGPNPQLEIIESYSFYSCSLISTIDLSSCSKLNKIGTYAFSRCTSVSSILLPSNLKTCDSYCFEGTQIKSIHIPSSVIYMRSAVFQSCTKLINCSIDEDSNLTLVEWRTFSGVPIEYFYTPSKVSFFEGSAFENTPKMKRVEVSPDNTRFTSKDGVVYTKNMKELVYFPSINCINYTIPDGVTIIRGSAFTGSRIQYVTFPDSLESIGGYAFVGSSLKELKFTPNLTFISGSAFAGSSSLSQIDFSRADSLENLGGNAFSGTGLIDIVLPPSLTTIGDRCFSSCSKLMNVTLPKNLTSLGGGVFSSCSSSLSLQFDPECDLMIDNQLLITNKAQTILNQYMNMNPNQTVYIPENIITIKSSAFYRMTNVLEVIFNGTKVQNIGNTAFYGCSNLKSINFPSSLLSISVQAFSYCTSLTSIEFGSNLNIIDEECFLSCSNLETVFFSSCKTIYSSAFKLCKKLINFSTSNNLKRLESYSFSNCISLLTIEIPSTISIIGSHAFEYSGIEMIIIDPATSNEFRILEDFVFCNCYHLHTIQIPSSIVILGEQTFRNCNLTYFEVPKEVTEIRDLSFQNCQSLEIFHIPFESKLSIIGSSIFSGCIRLSKIECNQTTSFITELGALFSIDKKRLIVFPPASSIKFFCFPQEVEIIYSGAFIGCSNLHYITIPDNSIRSIGMNAFENCNNLVSINIPICVQTIGTDAFKGCTKILCGQTIESQNPTFRQQLVEQSKLPKRSLSKCNFAPSVKNCFQLSRISFMNFLPFILIFRK